MRVLGSALVPRLGEYSEKKSYELLAIIPFVAVPYAEGYLNV